MKPAIKYNEIWRLFSKFFLVFKSVYGRKKKNFLRVLRLPGNADRDKPVLSSLIIVKFYTIYRSIESLEKFGVL
jgi:hypothetical protein